MTAAEEWINLILKRGPELRRAGILSIGCDSNSAVLAPAEPEASDVKEDVIAADAADEPINHWENPTSYPTGRVPDFEVDDKMPEIPDFPDRPNS